MKLKNIFLSLILSLLTFSNSFAMRPVGLTNGAGVCYANAAFQFLFAIPGFKNYLSTKATTTSDKLLGLYLSYEENIPNNALKMEIIRDLMGEDISNQYMFGFIEKLFLKIDRQVTRESGTLLEHLKVIFKELNIVIDVNENHIANIVHTGGHYFAEIKYDGQWYKVDDSVVIPINNPTMADLRDQIKQVISISLASRIDIDEELALGLSLSELINQEKQIQAKYIIKEEEIYSLQDLSKINGLISDEEAFNLMTIPGCLIKETDLLSETGFEMLTEIIALKM